MKRKAVFLLIGLVLMFVSIFSMAAHNFNLACFPWLILFVAYWLIAR